MTVCQKFEKDTFLHSPDIRQRLNELLHSQKVQYAVVALVVFDCIIVIVELLLDLKAIEGIVTTVLFVCLFVCLFVVVLDATSFHVIGVCQPSQSAS